MKEEELCQGKKVISLIVLLFLFKKRNKQPGDSDLRARGVPNILVISCRDRGWLNG